MIIRQSKQQLNATVLGQGKIFLHGSGDDIWFMAPGLGMGKRKLGEDGIS